MTTGIKTIIFPVKDIAKAKEVFAVLGAKPSIDQPYYVGFDVDGQHIGLDPGPQHSGMPGPVSYWHVEDIRQSLAALLALGAVVQRDIKDVGGGRLIAAVKDTDGNLIGLLQPS